MPANKINIDASLHPVKAVTIFHPSKAEFMRKLQVDLKSGSNVIEVSNISSHVDVESPRIHGFGDSAWVFDIHCDTRLADAPERYRSSKIAKTIRALEAQRKEVEVERTIRQQESSLLDEAARASLKEKPSQSDIIRSTFLWQKRELAAIVGQLDERIAKIEKDVWFLQNSSKGETDAVIVATVIAENDFRTTFELTYLVAGASWHPQYDLRATTTSDGRPSQNVTLQFNAIITQSTGENWKGSVLTLSTASPLQNLSVPHVDTLKIAPIRSRGQLSEGGHTKPALVSGSHPRNGGLVANALPAVNWHNPPQLIGGARATQVARTLSAPVTLPRAGLTAESARTIAAPASSVAALLPPPLHEDAFFVQREDLLLHSPEVVREPAGDTRSALSAPAYALDRTVSLPSDGMKHKLTVVALDLPATVSYACVPQKATTVFVEYAVKNASEHELLAGPTSVFVDDRLVTKTSLNHVGANESFDCVLGVDGAIKVAYQVRTLDAAAASRGATTTVTNGHPFSVSTLVVRDVVPTADEDAGIHVVLHKPAHLAQAAREDRGHLNHQSSEEVKAQWTKVENGRGGEKDGMYEWICSLKAGEEVKLEAEWEIKAPDKVRWEEKHGLIKM